MRLWPEIIFTCIDIIDGFNVQPCVSTGLADNPVRAISFSLAGVGGQEEDDWFVVER